MSAQQTKVGNYLLRERVPAAQSIASLLSATFAHNHDALRPGPSGLSPLFSFRQWLISPSGWRSTASALRLHFAFPFVCVSARVAPSRSCPPAHSLVFGVAGNGHLSRAGPSRFDLTSACSRVLPPRPAAPGYVMCVAGDAVAPHLAGAGRYFHRDRNHTRCTGGGSITWHGRIPISPTNPHTQRTSR